MRQGNEKRRAIGRRRRRLYRTIAVLSGLALVGVAVGVFLYLRSRPTTYRPGEENTDITRKLAKGIPEDAPTLRLEDVTQDAGLGAFRTFVGARTSQLPEDMGSGAAWGDFDNDGDDDLMLVSAGGPLDVPAEKRAPSELYENLGDGTFRRAPGFPDVRIQGMGAAWGDYDGDGWLDVVLTGYNALRLYRNEGGKFTRSTAISERKGFWSGATWGDFDRDGDLDLYVCGYVRYVPSESGRGRATQQYGTAVPYTLNPSSFEPEKNLLFRNNGDGTFEEVADALGVANPQGRSLSALWYDFDDDGWLDLYVANDISDNVFYHNKGGSFEEISRAAWVADYRGAMGIAVGDWNRDGDDDLFISHWVAQENALYDSLWHDFAKPAPTTVTNAASAEENSSPLAGSLRFMDVADSVGLGQIALQKIGWGAAFADFDADGWLDLAVANGSTFETDDSPKRLRRQSSFLFWNRQGRSFHDLAPLIPAMSDPHVARGLAVSDYDADGDLDLLIVDHGEGVRLLRNDSAHGNWLEVRLRSAPREPGGRPGRGDGARLVVRVGDTALRRAVGSASYLSQDSATVHFGLGEATQVDTLEVHWPRGTSTSYHELAGNAVWEITEGDPTPRRVDGSRPADASDAATADRARIAEFWKIQRAAVRAMKVEKDIPRAIELFRAALELNPAHDDSHFFLGNSLAAVGDVDGALAEFREVMRLNPLDHRAFTRWGTLRALTATTEQQLDEARDALERAHEINPEETGALLVLGEVSVMRGDMEVAAQQLEWATRTNPRAVGGFFLRAFIAWKQGRPGEARELLLTAKAARGPEWKPEGTTAEGDVKMKMHEEITPLTRFSRAWDGSLNLDEVFAPLSEYLKNVPWRASDATSSSQ